jgi:hypothetical protein
VKRLLEFWVAASLFIEKGGRLWIKPFFREKGEGFEKKIFFLGP